MNTGLHAVRFLAGLVAILAAPAAFAAANLTPYQPAGWSSRIVVSRTSGTSTDGSSLTTSDTLYIDWAVLNNGSSATTSSFSTQLYVDGVLRTSWSTSPPLSANYYTYITDYSIGKLSAGSHTLRIKTDSGGAVAESSESDNEYTRTITVSGGSANLTPYQPSGWSSRIVVSRSGGTNTDSSSLSPSDTLYIDWAVINNGAGATTSSFSTQLYVDGVLRTTWSTSPPLNAGYYSYITDYSIGTLSAGSHTLRIKTDSGGSVAESSESDNEYTRTITVSGGSANLTPYQPSGWASKIVVSKTTGTNTDGTSLTTGDTLYIDWAVINSGSGATAASFSTQLFLDGVLQATWSTSPPLNGGYYSYITDYSLGKLSAGSHTLRIKTDAGGTIAESSEADNEYTRTITVSGVSGSTNVTPYQPSGWANKIVVSKTTGTNSDGTSLTTGDTLYIDWAVINNGTSATAVSFSTQLFLDGVLKATWSTSPPLNANYYSYITDYSLGKLSAGSHTLRIKTDAGGALLESNEADNEYTRTITVGSVSGGSTNVTPYQPSGWANKIVVSRSTGTSTDGTSLTTGDTLYIDWAVINNGTSATAVSFSTQLFLDGVLKATWFTSPPLNTNYYSYITDYSLGKLSAGSHTLRIKTDAGGALVESNEADNEYTRTITVSGVSGSTNVTPYQPSGWANKIVVSKSTGTSTDGTSLTTGDTLYIDWAVINNGTSATAVSFSTQLFLDGVLKATWSTSPPLNANYYSYITDYSLGKLSAGSHTLRIKTDAGGALLESNEADNEYTRTITVGSVVGGSTNVTPYQPSGWANKIVISRSTGTSTDSTALTPADTLYIDWAVINNGTSATVTKFSTQLFVDGVLKATWSTSPPLNPNYYTYITDYSLGKLSAGSHTLRIKTDAGGALLESNEADNEYTRTITVGSGGATPNLTPYQPSTWANRIVVSTQTGTGTDSGVLNATDTLYIDWAVINNGASATAATFSTQLFVDGTLRATWFTPAPLNANYYSYITDYPLGKLAAGSHTLRIKTDAGGSIIESNETDNEYTRTITVGGAGSGPNLTPYQPPGWSGKIVVSKATGTSTDGTGLTASDTLYVDWAVINTGASATAATFSTQLFVDGALKATWPYSAPLSPNSFTAVRDYSLGRLALGPHTLRIKTDAGSTIIEASESDNDFSRTITIGDRELRAVTFAAIDSPLTANPSAGGGLRIFPEARSAADTTNRSTVRASAQVYPAIAGIPVYFRVFDLDDPTDRDISYVNRAGQARTSSAIALDANGARGDDNRPDGTTTPASGSLSGASAFTDASGIASVVMTVSRQPGNNFAVAASLDQAYSNELRLRTTDGTVIEDSSGSALPTPRAARTEMLTTWRTLHVESDHMATVRGNVVRGTVRDVQPGAGQNTTDVTIENIPAPGLTGTTGLENRFANGRLRVNGGSYFAVRSNTANILASDVVTINGAIDTNAIGQPYELEDDDYLRFPEGAALPNANVSRLNEYFRQAFVEVIFDLPNYSVAAFVSNSDTNGNLANEYAYDNQRAASRELWQAYILGAFQPHEGSDGDPDSEGAVVGQVDNLGSSGSGAHIFLEPLSDFGSLEFETVVHEAGHLMGGEHGDFGMMAQSANNEHSDNWTNVSLAKFRSIQRR
ncbi:MAG: CARDB domain-containing protein [Thermoanaerobaculia bacterium]